MEAHPVHGSGAELRTTADNRKARRDQEKKSQNKKSVKNRREEISQLNETDETEQWEGENKNYKKGEKIAIKK